MSGEPAEREAALHTCRACPVLAECRSWALALHTADDLVGVLGGMAPSDRAAIRRDRQRALRAATSAA